MTSHWHSGINLIAASRNWIAVIWRAENFFSKLARAFSVFIGSSS